MNKATNNAHSATNNAHSVMLAQWEWSWFISLSFTDTALYNFKEQLQDPNTFIYRSYIRELAKKTRCRIGAVTCCPETPETPETRETRLHAHILALGKGKHTPNFEDQKAQDIEELWKHGTCKALRVYDQQGAIEYFLKNCEHSQLGWTPTGLKLLKSTKHLIEKT